jgi:two-component system alkaline phosphatase synthesis response regulator PhoP
MPQRRILVIEDDPAIRQGIVDALEFEHYAVEQADDGEAGLQCALTGEFDLVLLDLILPNRDGLEVLREVRSARPTLPVIILTARGEESDRVTGLRLGADDYVVKPFSLKEMLARITAVLRRSPGRPTDLTEVAIPGGRVDFARREVCFDGGERTTLSEREADLLAYLARNRGRAVARDEILTRVWRISGGIDTRTIDMHVVRLREKLRDNSSSPRVLLTVRGKGYMFAEP